MIKTKTFIVIFFIFLTNIKYSFAENSDKIYKKIDLFSEVLNKIKTDYVDDVDQARVMDAAINGILQSLDPYSSYMSPEMFDNMETETKGSFGGLGIEVGMEAGVVNITIRRKGVKKAIVLKIVREIIQIKSVTAKIIDNNIGYLRLTSFNENSSQQLKSKINDIKNKNEINGFILDLRNNPGGLLTQAIEISDFFLEDGEIVSTRGRKKRENRKWFAKKGDQIDGKPLIVLINYGSASASEIVAGALKDHKRAILIGANSYGKGSVQAIIHLKNKGAIRLTISKYYLPSGKSISEVGVTPDFEIEEENDDFAINTKNDNQLNFAVKLFNG